MTNSEKLEVFLDLMPFCVEKGLTFDDLDTIYNKVAGVKGESVVIEHQESLPFS